MATKRASVEANNPLNKMFQRTGPREDPEAQEAPLAQAKKRGRKKQGEPQPKQTTIIFSEDQLDWLDYVTYDSRKGSGKVVSKSELLRELVNLLREKDLSLRGVKTEQDVRNRLKETLNID